MNRLKKIKSNYFMRCKKKFGKGQLIIFIQTMWSSETKGNFLILKGNYVPIAYRKLLFRNNQKSLYFLTKIFNKNVYSYNYYRLGSPV